MAIITPENRKYGWIPSKPDSRDIKLSLTRSIISDSDLRGSSPPVYNQLQTGSCVGNAVAYGFEYDLIAHKKPDFTPSRLFIYYNARLLEGSALDPDAGAEIRDGIKSIRYFGIVDENTWPFNSKITTVRPATSIYEKAAVNKTGRYAAVDQNLNVFATTLTHKYPIIFGTSVFEAFESEQVAQTGVVPMPKSNEKPIGGHAMAVVGVKLAERQFIVRNSWGPEWGDRGYAYFPFDYILNPDLASDFWVLSGIAI